MQGASMSAEVGVYDESPPSESDSRPTINLFEQWEGGAHMPKVANARDYSFPSHWLCHLLGCVPLKPCL